MSTGVGENTAAAPLSDFLTFHSETTLYALGFSNDRGLSHEARVVPWEKVVIWRDIDAIFMICAAGIYFVPAVS